MKSVIIGVVTVLVVAAVIGGVFWWRHNSLSNTVNQPSAVASPISTPSGLEITDVTVGTGAAATAGQSLTVSYIGTLTNGTVFDSTSKDGGQPFTFTLGAGQVIKGWDQGMVGMKVGGERKLVIPASLGYGAQAVGSIPPNSTLDFDVTLIAIK